jgi:hypothetical protein
MRRTCATVLVIAVLISGRISASAADNHQPQNPDVIARAISRVAEHARTQAPLTVGRSLRKQRAPRLKPIVIGAAVGAGLLGLAVSRYCDSGSCGSDTVKAMLWGAGLGAALGYVAGTR